jgi:hypothetical protein
MRHVQVAGITIVAATMALTGCGGGKPAQVGRARPSVSGVTTVPGTVRAGGFCAVRNAVGKTADGSAVRCTSNTRSRDTRKRWVVVKGATGAQVGKFCKPQGASAKAPDGSTLRCAKKRGQQQPRWVKK